MGNPERGVFEKLVSYGILAPSADNTQPWRFKIKDGSLLVIHDKGRADFLYNVKNIASLIALGAVIENISIAAKGFGYECEVSYFPGNNGPDTIASIGLKRREKAQDPLFPFIEKRCVNRRLYEKKAFAPGVREALISESTSEEGITLRVVEDRASLTEVASMVAAGDNLLFNSRPLLSGLLPWIRWSKKEALSSRDGMGLDTLEINFLQKRLFRAIRSWPLISFLNVFGFSRIAALQSVKLIKRSSGVFLITSGGRAPLDYVKGGRVMERVWLRAASLGLSVQPMTGITFLCSILQLDNGKGLSEKEAKIAKEILGSLRKTFSLKEGDGLIILCRAGYAAPPSGRTLRRPVEDVLEG